MGNCVDKSSAGASPVSSPEDIPVAELQTMSNSPVTDISQREKRQKIVMYEPTSLASLPTDCWVNICSFLSFSEALKLQRVSKEALRLVEESFSDLDLCSYARQMTDANFIRLARFSFVERVCLRHCRRVSSSGLETIRKFPSLRRLDLTELHSLNDSVSAAVSSLPLLQELQLSLTGLTRTGFNHISNIKSLQTLNLHGSNLFDESMGFLRRCPSISNLDISGCQNITDAGLSHLPHIGRIEYLNLASLPRLTNAAYESIKQLRSLKALNVGATATGDEGVANLHVLRLRRLSLDETDVTDEGLVHLAGMPITILTLDHTGITDEGVAHLVSGKLPLRELSMTGCSISDEALRHLSAIPTLSSLLLNGCNNITDVGIQAISTLPLQFLQISLCQRLTSMTFGFLENIATLRFLSIHSTRTITEADIFGYKGRNPKVKVECPQVYLRVSFPMILALALDPAQALAQANQNLPANLQQAQAAAANANPNNNAAPPLQAPVAANQIPFAAAPQVPGQAQTIAPNANLDPVAANLVGLFALNPFAALPNQNPNPNQQPAEQVDQNPGIPPVGPLQALDLLMRLFLPRVPDANGNGNANANPNVNPNLNENAEAPAPGANALVQAEVLDFLQVFDEFLGGEPGDPLDQDLSDANNHGEELVNDGPVQAGDNEHEDHSDEASEDEDEDHGDGPHDTDGDDQSPVVDSVTRDDQDMNAAADSSQAAEPAN